MNDARRSILVLLDLTKTLSNEGPLESSLQAVTDAALELFSESKHCSVRLLDDSGTVLLSAGRSGSGSSNRPVSFKPGEGVAGWVVEHGAVVNVRDTESDPRFVRKAGQGFSIGSLLAIPMWSVGRVIGVLAMTSPQKHAFDAEAEVLGQLLANCAVPPIERARLARMAITDHRTGAYNTRYLFPRLREEIDRARTYNTPISILLFDLDHFKRVNDAHGHATGDRVLEVFADHVRATVRKPDILVRRGGEEFILIMPFTGGDEAQLVADRIRQGLADRVIRADEAEIRQTVSIGAATWDGKESAERLEARADALMYEGKRLGRNKVVSDQQGDDDPDGD